MRLAIMFLSGSGAKRHFAHLIGGKKPALAWRLLKRLQHGSEVALGSHWGRIGVALGWLWSRNWLPINTLCGGFDVALGGFAVLRFPAIQNALFSRIRRMSTRCWVGTR